MSCLSCYATTTNGLALCERCRVALVVALEYLPVYFRNLARWRPGRGGSREVPGSRPPPGLGSQDDRIAQALDYAGTDLVGWAMALADDRPEIRWPLDLADLDEVEQSARLCEIFAEAVTTIATLPWCGELVHEVMRHEAQLRGLTETSVSGWYAGICRRDHCEAATHVVPGLTWVTCPGCGATTYARDHIDVVIREASDWCATPKRLAEALVALVDSEESVERLRDRVRRWGDRGHIEAVRKLDTEGDPVGPKRYRLGDVLARIVAEGPTRHAVLDESATA